MGAERADLGITPKAWRVHDSPAVSVKKLDPANCPDDPVDAVPRHGSPNDTVSQAKLFRIQPEE